MIHIEGKRLTITIEEYGIEATYADIVVQLIDLLSTQDPGLCLPSNQYYAIYSLLQAMMPDYGQIKAMNGVKGE